MKRFLVGISALLLLGCASLPNLNTRPEAHNLLSCEHPEGYEYVCYNEAECQNYMEGYWGVVYERFNAQKNGFFLDQGPVQTVYINLFIDYHSYTMLGRIDAEMNEDRTVHAKLWTMACDMENNIIGEWYDELNTKWKIPATTPAQH